MERGSIVKRQLDFYLGVPLVAIAACGVRFRRSFFPSRFAAGASRRVGVLCLGAIGDLLLATGLLSGLRAALPQAEIEVITSGANAGAHCLLPPGFRASAFPVTDIPGMIRHIRSARFDILVDAGQWPRVSALVSAFSGARCTVGFATPGQYRHYAYDRAVLHRNDRHEVENFLALGKALFPELEGRPTVQVPEKPCGTHLAPARERLVFCHMWPSGLHSFLKEWPAEHWKTLAGELLGAGYVPVFTGGGRDAGATEAFLSRSGLDASSRGVGAVSVAGKMSLSDLAYHMRGAAAVVSVNTGTMHLAALAGAPTIGLHGPTNPLRWGPVGERTCSLLPETGTGAYLNLGFEYPRDAEPVLRHLPVSDVIAALKGFGLHLP